MIPEQETYQQQLTRQRDDALTRATKAETDLRAAEDELAAWRRPGRRADRYRAAWQSARRRATYARRAWQSTILEARRQQARAADAARTVDILQARLAEAEANRDGAYRERAHLTAWLAAIHPAVITPATDIADPGWQILYLTAGGRQMSWHIAPRDAELYHHVEHVDPTDPRAQWDGHTTDQKYEAIRELTSGELRGAARAGQAEARLRELEGALDWQTSCLSCARVLDSSYAETARAEQAEARLAAVRALHFTRGRNCHGDPVCNECSPLQAVPCPTVRALDGATTNTAAEVRP
ncbi:hypothetical protein ACIGZJ_30975 [Kitasatospora sp. NPDC052868]|uniref:hypothetical protein n=1 Tax=Kitasatospora sp. NPDC052868 TaxID=3364060 RepID=UPI0037C7A2EF